MKEYEDQYIQEWNKMVNEAHLNLTGNCPLIEDSVILWINDFVQPKLQKEKLDLPLKHYSKTRRERKILQDLTSVLEAYEHKKPLLSNQGQPLDGYSALSNFLDVARRASTLLEELK